MLFQKYFLAKESQYCIYHFQILSVQVFLSFLQFYQFSNKNIPIILQQLYLLM
ncbi:unnamed protein product [Meloidogyne enterolobii]|uniref:Uncharacterized protein n=1 Tax=Meloidogyne enterolobii TaxID=390850 RepID=A0ACB0ZQB7_MELEN